MHASSVELRCDYQYSEYWWLQETSCASLPTQVGIHSFHGFHRVTRSSGTIDVSKGTCQTTRKTNCSPFTVFHLLDQWRPPFSRSLLQASQDPANLVQPAKTWRAAPDFPAMIIPSISVIRAPFCAFCMHVQLLAGTKYGPMLRRVAVYPALQGVLAATTRKGEEGRGWRPTNGGPLEALEHVVNPCRQGHAATELSHVVRTCCMGHGVGGGCPDAAAVRLIPLGCSPGGLDSQFCVCRHPFSLN
jgi:hypothetical protein